MAQLFKQVDYNLVTLIQNIDMGVIGLPDIQRPFKWNDAKVRDLFGSMYKGYPVGYLLFWANAHQDNVKVIGTDNKQKAPSLLIVDGQQRLTSLYAVIKGKEVLRDNFEKDKIQISFNPLSEEFIVFGEVIRDGKEKEYIKNISELWDKDINLYKFISSYVNELRAIRTVTPEEENKIADNISKLKNLEGYPFSALELDPNINEDAVADIFVKINSQGQSLNTADFILTLMSVYWEDGRKELEKFSRESKTPSNEVSPFNYIMQPDPDQLLRCSVGLGFRRARLQNVYNILRGKDLETGEFSAEKRDQQFNKLKDAQAKALDVTTWHEFLKAIQQAGFIREDIISSGNNILYSYVMFLIGRYDYNLDYARLKQLIARWFFFTSLTGRYTGSPETIMEMDLAKLRTITTADEFETIISGIITSNLPNDYWDVTLPNNLATSSPRSPELFGYYAAQIVLGVKGLFSRSEVRNLIQAGLKSKKSALEKHHLFPKRYLEKIGYQDQTLRNQIANFALVEWSDNIEISDTSHQEYLPTYINKFSVEEVAEMYHWHALPQNWQEMKYEDFLIERRKMIAGVIKEAFERL